MLNSGEVCRIELLISRLNMDNKMKNYYWFFYLVLFYFSKQKLMKSSVRCHLLNKTDENYSFI